jgi:hypothetical protein
MRRTESTFGVPVTALDVKKFAHGVQVVISMIMWETDSLGQIVSW